MQFRITFHGPFRVATGEARDGLDAAVDERQPLPATSLKGVMAAAALALGVPDGVADAVFGTAQSESPWSWTSARFEVPPVARARARVAIDPDTGTAQPGALVLAPELWAECATFQIDQLHHLDADEVSRHEAVLLAAAHGVTSLGADRRRGLGWVTVEGTDPVLDDEAIERFAAIVGAS